MYQVAIKIINKDKVDEEDLAKYLPGEITILQRVSHPSIIDIYQIVETDPRCFFVTGIAENGCHLDYMMSRHSNILEAEGQYVFNQICQPFLIATFWAQLIEISNWLMCSLTRIQMSKQEVSLISLHTVTYSQFKLNDDGQQRLTHMKISITMFLSLSL